MQSPAFDASMPPIATTGTRTTSQIAASPSTPIGVARVGLGRRRPDGAGADVVGALLRGRDRLVDARRRDAEHEADGARELLAPIGSTEVHAVRVERERGLDVVVDDERDPGLARDVGDRPAALDEVERAQAL